MKISIGSDHAGYEVKDVIKRDLIETGYEVSDVGTFGKEPVDYPDIAYKVASKVRDKEADLGILICGTGIGMSIAANKVKRVRAALCHNEMTAEFSRQHNDANVLAVGARVLTCDEIKKVVDVWLKAEFLGDRHKRRVDKIEEIEECTSCRN